MRFKVVDAKTNCAGEGNVDELSAALRPHLISAERAQDSRHGVGNCVAHELPSTC